MWKQNAKSRIGASGVVKLRRATYNTNNGFSQKGGWWEIRAEVWKRDKGLCVSCLRLGKTVAGKEVHHIISLSKGGTTTKNNLITLCQACHDRRHNHLFRTRS